MPNCVPLAKPGQKQIQFRQPFCLTHQVRYFLRQNITDAAKVYGLARRVFFGGNRRETCGKLEIGEAGSEMARTSKLSLQSKNQDHFYTKNF